MKNFVDPEIEIMKFEIADVITLSNMLPVAPIGDVEDVLGIVAID